jgi:hypothetical protein
MLKKFLIPTLLFMIFFTGCKEEEPVYDFNLSATTWKGKRVRGSTVFNYTFIFSADGSMGGNENFNGSPQNVTGTWVQDKTKVSVNYTVAGYAGTWRGEGEIDNAKTGMVYKGYWSQGAGAFDYTVNLTLK